LRLIKIEISEHVETRFFKCPDISRVGGSQFVSSVSQSRVSISALAKSKSGQSRKSRHFQKVDLDHRLRFLDFVLASMSRPKSLNPDLLKFTKKLDYFSIES
jgi:hypothetical protein